MMAFGGTTKRGLKSRAFVFAALACAFIAGMLACPHSAWALISTQRACDPLTIQVDDEISLARIDAVPLPATSNPESITAGIPCGMTEMCGQDPCLCGAVDEWGACACNGKRETRPTWAIECDGQGVVALVDVFGSPWLVSVGAGSVDATVTATLAHHETAQASTHIRVAGWTVLDVVKIVVAVALAALAVALVVALVALVVKGIRRGARRVAAFARKRKEGSPL